MSDKEPAITDQILDLLLDALIERQRAKGDHEPLSEPSSLPEPETEPDVAETSSGEATAEPLMVPEMETEPVEEEEEEPETAAETPLASPADATEPAETRLIEYWSGKPDDEPFPPEPEPLPTVHLDRVLWRLLLTMIVLVLLANIPFNRYGTSLARAMPDSAALIIRDGLVLKGSGDEVYVLRDNKLRWISTLDAFEEYGYRWSQVHEVEDAFLADFEQGPPIHLLLKCQTSPHIYAYEDGKKRWIKDIPTFEAQLYVWEDVRFVSCNYLRQLPDGLPIPEDAGPPPQP